MANERLLQLLSDVVQSNIQTENRISHRLTTLVSQSAVRSPRSETGADDGGHARDTSDGKAPGDDAAAGGITTSTNGLYDLKLPIGVGFFQGGNFMFTSTGQLLITKSAATRAQWDLAISRRFSKVSVCMDTL